MTEDTKRHATPARGSLADYVSVTDAAAELGLSRQRVLQLIAEKRLEVMSLRTSGRRGFSYLIKRTSLRSFQRTR